MSPWADEWCSVLGQNLHYRADTQVNLQLALTQHHCNQRLLDAGYTAYK